MLLLLLLGWLVGSLRNYKDNLYNLVNYIKYNSNDLKEILKKKQHRPENSPAKKRGNGNFYD